jgi:hypothetical protein
MRRVIIEVELNGKVWELLRNGASDFIGQSEFHIKAKV